MEDRARDEIRRWAEDLKITQYTLVAVAVVMVCEYFDTLDDEKRLIWPAKSTLPKYLFLANRYIPFVSMIITLHLMVVNADDEYCERGLFVSGMLVSTQYIAAEAILTFRAYAVWGYTRPLAIALIVTFVAFTAGGFYISVRFLDGAVAHRLVPNGCAFFFTNRIEWVSMAAVMFSETVNLCMLLYKVYEPYRAIAKYRFSPILHTILRDGLFFYFLILLTTIANTIVVVAAPPLMRNYLLTPQAVFHNILCNRLLLNIRGVYDSLCNNTLKSSTPMTTISFAHRKTEDVRNDIGDPASSADIELQTLNTDNERIVSDHVGVEPDSRSRGAISRDLKQDQSAVAPGSSSQAQA